MRKPILLVAPVLALAVAACEDGPVQTYQPASGNLFNNGDTPASVGDASASLGQNYGGSSKTEICDGTELQAQWELMIHQPIQPPRFMAGIDLADGNQYPGLTIEKIQTGPIQSMDNVPNPTGNKAGPTRLCQGTNAGAGGNASDVGGSLVSYWGNNAEVQLEWAIPTHKSYLLTLNPGYVGTMEWDFKGNHYIWQIGHKIQKGPKGGPYTDFQFHWAPNPHDATLVADIDEIYRGVVSYFVPDIYSDTPTNCDQNGTCLIAPSGNQDGTGRTLFGIRPAAFYIYTGDYSKGIDIGSTVQGAYIFNVKTAPYSVSQSTLKMFDAEGPTSVADIGDLMPKKHCSLKLGGTFQDLMDNCINVFSDPNVNKTSMNKVLGNLQHDDQNFIFSVVGINQNYRPHSLDTGGAKEFDIIGDKDLPSDDPMNTTAVDFTFDVRTYGPILNDWYKTGDGKGNTLYKRDRHGSGAVWVEYQREVQAELAAAYHALHPSVPVRTQHDPACYFPMCTDNAGNFAPGSTTCDSYGNCTGKWGIDTCEGNGYNWGNPNVGNGLANGFDVNKWRPAEGCTGFEGFLSNAYPTAGATDEEKAFNSPLYASFNAIGGFKPGGPSVSFCNDPGWYDFCGFSGDLFGLSGDMFGGSYQRVLQYLGKGVVNDLPIEARDLRYYFKKFTIAYAKYMNSPESIKGDFHSNCTVGSTCAPTPADRIDFNAVHNQYIDTDYLFFDSFGGGASKSEYVSLFNADATHDPTSMELRTLLVGSNLQGVHFYRRLDREERAFFNALATDKTQAAWGYKRDKTTNAIVLDDYGFPIPNADVFMSNFAGSPAIAAIGYAGPGTPVTNGWKDRCDPTNDPPVKTAYYCATHLDADCTNPNLGTYQAPTDANGNLVTRENGKPLLDGYCGIFTHSAFALTGGVAPGVQIVETKPLIESAKIIIPSYANPYDVTTKNSPITVLSPWKPKQEGVGYPVAATGTRDVFVQTEQFEFAGQVITPVVDYLPVQVAADADAGTPAYTGVQILAYESEDFLGDLFLCHDPITAANRAGTGAPGDILYAHMYTSVQTILDWIASHPGAQDACGIVVRYSPYNNYPDYIESTVNGVRLSIEQGAGLGRVADATVYLPGTGSPAAP